MASEYESGSNYEKIITKKWIIKENTMLKKKIKGTLKQHNVTPSQSHFCEIKLST